MQKRGISAVVATVLIILITVAAITLIWTVIIPLVRDNLGTSVISDVSISTTEGYTLYDLSTSRACVQVKRGSTEGDLTGIQFNFVSQKKSGQVSVSPAPDLNSGKTYCFNISGFGKIDSIGIAPISKVGGVQKLGALSSTETNIPEGDLASYSTVYYNLTNGAVGGPVGGCTSNSSCNNACLSGAVCNLTTGICSGGSAVAPTCNASAVACGATVTPSNGCGSCSVTGTYCASGSCNSSGQCAAVCVPENDSAFCSRLGRVCGSVSGSDNCGVLRNVSSCGSCSGTCNSSGQCVVLAGNHINQNSVFPYALSQAGGVYYVDEDLYLGTAGFVAQANGSILDCQGHFVRGNQLNYARGYSASSLDNVAVRNCTFDGFYFNYYLSMTNNATLLDSVFKTNGGTYSVYLSQANRTLMRNITLQSGSSTSYGIYDDRGYQNNLSFSNISSTFSTAVYLSSATAGYIGYNNLSSLGSVGLQVYPPASGLRVESNNISRASYGVYFSGVVTGTVFINNRACLGGNYGFYCTSYGGDGTTNTFGANYCGSSGCNGFSCSSC